MGRRSCLLLRLDLLNVEMTLRRWLYSVSVLSSTVCLFLFLSMLNRRSRCLRMAPVQYNDRTMLADRVLVTLGSVMTCMRCRNRFTAPPPDVSDPSLVLSCEWNVLASAIMASAQLIGIMPKSVVCLATTWMILLTLRRSSLINLAVTIGALPVLIPRKVIWFRDGLAAMLQCILLHFRDLRNVVSSGVCCMGREWIPMSGSSLTSVPMSGEAIADWRVSMVIRPVW